MRVDLECSTPLSSHSGKARSPSHSTELQYSKQSLQLKQWNAIKPHCQITLSYCVAGTVPQIGDDNIAFKQFCQEWPNTMPGQTHLNWDAK